MNQKDTPLEHYLDAVELFRYDKRSKQYKRHQFEMCCAVASVICLKETHNPNLHQKYGGYEPNPAQMVFDCANDPTNFPALQKQRENIDPADHAGNRIFQYYPWVVSKLFGAEADFTWHYTHEWMIEQLRYGRSLQVLLKDPSHCVAVVDYDKYFHIRDPLSGDRRESTLHIMPFSIVYYPRRAC